MAGSVSIASVFVADYVNKYASIPGNSWAYCYAELAFSSLAVVATIANTGRDGQAEFA